MTILPWDCLTRVLKPPLFFAKLTGEETVVSEGEKL